MTVRLFLAVIVSIGLICVGVIWYSLDSRGFLGAAQAFINPPSLKASIITMAVILIVMYSKWYKR